MTTFRFIHVSDIHLGYEQYNLAERADDFARAYLDMVEHAITVRADFVLIAGDLFHKANADAWTLRQAMHGLQLLRESSIPVVAIEGNHDAPHYHKHLSWMEFLGDHGLLSLLNVDRDAHGRAELRPFDPNSGHGSWLDVAGARIYGIKYYGAALPRILEEVEDQIEPAPFTILMLHAGMEGQVPHMHGGLTMGQINPLHGAVDYLALGHVHKQLKTDWIHNPGSTEVNSFEEIDWPHGFFDVTVDTDAEVKHQAEFIPSPHLRPFHRIIAAVSDDDTSEVFAVKAEERIAATTGIPERAIIELDLGGVASFGRQEVPIERLKAAVEERFNPLAVRVRNSIVKDGILPVSSRERMDRVDVERTVVERLVYSRPEYADSAAAWAKLILDIKGMAVENTVPATIADHIAETARRVSEGDAPLPAPEASVTE
ncbi:MAG TPA: exonuclease SbcCD subunit D [Chloroflexota bacterium]|nr:exonuclease SbcCD subunit D [Chloroflexota bacterium]